MRTDVRAATLLAFLAQSCAAPPHTSRVPRAGAVQQQPARLLAPSPGSRQTVLDPAEPPAPEETEDVGNAEPSGTEKTEENADEHSAYAVYASAALTSDVHGVRGRLELLQDKRLTPALRDCIAGRTDCEPEDHPEFWESIDHEPLHRAIVRMLDASGREVAVRRLPRELAYLDTTYLYGTSKPTYLVTVDLRAGAGSWAPICTYLAELEHGTLQWLSTTDRAGNNRIDITVCESHHASFRIVPSERQRGKELLSVEGAVDGTLILRRYAWDGTVWRLASSRSSGNWDSDRPFPDPAQFPSFESRTP